MDLRLPGLNGIEFMVRAQALDPALRFLIHTGSPEEQLPRSAIQVFPVSGVSTWPTPTWRTSSVPLTPPSLTCRSLSGADASARVLVIDDEPRLRAAPLRTIWMTWATRPQRLRTVKTRLESFAPDAVLVDLNMPVMDGYSHPHGPGEDARPAHHCGLGLHREVLKR